VRAIGGGWKKAPAMPPVGWQQTDFNDRDWPEVKTVADEPGNRFKVSMPTAFAAPVIPAKARTAPFQFEDGDRVVFVGATFFERAQLSEHLEATLAGTLGGKHVTFRNLGWSADTTYADSRGIFDRPEVGYLRMVEHIRAEEPTVALICYGQNEALTAGLTPEQYSDQLGRLLDELTASGIACVLVSPHELLPAVPPVPSPMSPSPDPPAPTTTEILLFALTARPEVLVPTGFRLETRPPAPPPPPTSRPAPPPPPATTR
jgi:hypothetical protein